MDASAQDQDAALSPDQVRTWTRLAALLELLPHALDARLSTETGFTRFEFAVLDTLGAAPDGALGLSELASATNATLPRLSRVVTRLEDNGTVHRMPAANDGRAVNAVLTPLGRDRLECGRVAHAGAIRDLLLGGLEPDEVTALGDIMAKSLTALDPDGRFAITRACDTGGAER